MNKKVLSIVSIVALLVIAACLIIKSNKQTARENPVTTDNSSNMTLTAKPAVQKQNVPHTASNWSNEPLPPGSNMQERLEKLAQQRGVPLDVLSNQLLAEMSNRFSNALNGPLVFYGKALDEGGAPLTGVAVIVGCVIFPEQQFMTNISTGANGSFEVQDMKGQALTISVSKDGYEEPEGTNEHSFIYYGTVKGFEPDPRNPVIFRLRKKTSEQK